jgi:hypothetical protein
MTNPFPFPLEVDDETGPILPAWYVHGWTAQNQLTANLPAPPNPNVPNTFPADQVFTVLQQSYADGDANPLGGYLTFWPSEPYTITEGGQSWRIPQRLCGTMTWPSVDVGTSPYAFSLEGSGRIFIWQSQLVVLLLNPANPHVTTDSGDPLTYHVIEHFRGGRQYDIAFDQDTPQGAYIYGTDTQGSLIVEGSVKPFQFDPLDPMGDMLPPVA